MSEYILRCVMCGARLNMDEAWHHDLESHRAAYEGGARILFDVEKIGD